MSSLVNVSNRKVYSGASSRKTRELVPVEIRENHELNTALKTLLPTNYNFEVHKTIWRLRSSNSKRVGLQFPEGLTLFACRIAALLKRFTDALPVILADVTYGACCVDDLSARSLGCDFLVHYGHSCLIPIDSDGALKQLYVFVPIHIDQAHFCDTIKLNFSPEKSLALVSTIQFVPSIQASTRQLRADGYRRLTLPQVKPLSPGEVLGCTSAACPDGVDALLYVGDGRFHLESAMISNPATAAFRYDPYSKLLTSERYDHDGMRAARSDAIRRASDASAVGIILGTLGRQGNPRIVQTLRSRLRECGKRSVLFLMSEIFPSRLARIGRVDAWVQVACPRLSIDWGEAFEKPLLTPYEMLVALGSLQRWQHVYPMDYYASQSAGLWSKR